MITLKWSTFWAIIEHEALLPVDFTVIENRKSSCMGVSVTRSLPNSQSRAPLVKGNFMAVCAYSKQKNSHQVFSCTTSF